MRLKGREKYWGGRSGKKSRKSRSKTREKYRKRMKKKKVKEKSRKECTIPSREDNSQRKSRETKVRRKQEKRSG